ncbi:MULTISPECIES: hypothetical protein [Bacillus]|uniref:Uncharacterized protein n=2 Tax=Bacillus TaxID=1386 RepID=A0A0M3R9W5_9BACI|nr:MULTISPECIES: hypothetical protein [Bacillus]ALC82136.1 hypothetical protein AM592_11480 [Bacillus gobiensis]MBP1080951.1 hypothetical protein [Bacillus capparidis]MED1095654.1 hypothetical protein [Bacillus capparidis]
MMKFYLVGAKLKPKILNNWELYDKAIVLELELANHKHKINKAVEYNSPPAVCPDNNASISFTAATLSNQKLFVGTHTEVLVYNEKNFKIENYISLPMFNDIHHVKPRTNGNILVVNTGLDMVIELSPKGKVINCWNVLGNQPWERFNNSIDYRKVPSTKPHESHPNFAFEINGDIWVTRCLQKDAVCLTDSNKKISIGREWIHDGIVYNNKIYFTQIDGRVVIVNANTLKVEKEIDLVKISNHNMKIGYCRGIRPLNEEKILVGFSRVRPSREFKPDGTITWKGQYGHMPTRLACFDIVNQKLLWEINLEDYDLNAIYSIN